MPTLTRAGYIPQGGTIGIIGGGQLGQMMALDAKYAGMKVIILDPTPKLWRPTRTNKRLKSWLSAPTC